MDCKLQVLLLHVFSESTCWFDFGSSATGVPDFIKTMVAGSLTEV